MESNVSRGRRGERMAADYLRERGWSILDHNWRDGPRELDLVVMRDGLVAIVEVKTRSSSTHGSPLEAIHARKRREIERAARAWIAVRGRAVRGAWTLRFDAISVRLHPRGRHEFVHIEGAWRVGE